MDTLSSLATNIGWYIKTIISIVGIIIILWGVLSSVAKTAHHSSTQADIIAGSTLIIITWTIVGAYESFISFLSWLF